ncbi:uncharacterized protein [Chelonus insularis]|uniref:uncharacterized protein n=1 Tax=Chelonus insularis TaxID=460826 RepID=UPI00158AEA59|nr:uncharacterized protein LOC118070402 [Chelonus insularis]
MGWTKRDNGRSYDSLNGYSTIIGFCPEKFWITPRKTGNAMEADAGVQLINHSSILKEAGLQVRVVIRDEDSSMISARLIAKIAVIGAIHIKKHTIHFSNEALHEELVDLFQKYASNSSKFSIAASSQSNESFNNIVANKAHKNKCLSTSAACDIRVAEAVCVKNDGEKRKETVKDKNEQHEGITYESNCGINKFNNYVRKDCDSNNNNIILEDETNVVYFDIKTTGFAANVHILQIAAICNYQIFNVYVYTKSEISTSASAVTQLYHKHGDLYHRNKKVESLIFSDALESFKQFSFNLSNGRKKCLLVAHNASFDVPRLLGAVINAKLLGTLDLIAGFADTLTLFRSVLIDRKGPGQFKLENVSKDFLQICDNDQQSFHDAAYDVVILQKLTETLKLESKLFNANETCD